ncbi:unnamed protein product [Schistosoma haematobium]|nr:unnamed protein product [Schistosoma haematobium]
MILSILFIAGYLWNSWTVFLWVLAWSAFALAMLIIFYRKIRDEHPLNIYLLVIYSIWIGTAIGISVLKLCMYLKLWVALIALDVGADILLFLITICFSQFTVGKSEVRVFFPHWTLAVLVLYTLFYIDLSNNLYLVGMVDFINTINETNSTPCW